MNISGWGAYPRVETELLTPRSPERLVSNMPEGPFICRGLGRSYGDAALGRLTTLSTLALDRMISFDPATDILTVEAGAPLWGIIEAFLPRGYFPPVVPGTKNVTVGGMVASHVHGKNHHLAGGFGAAVESLTLICADGRPRICSRNLNSELFHATIGGMGLTGIISQVSFRLDKVETAYIRQRTVVAHDLDAALDAFEAHSDSTYAVAWIDTLARGAQLGRSLIYLGEHAKRDELPDHLRGEPLKTRSRSRLSIPFDLPAGLMTRLTMGPLTFGYFHAGALREGEHFVHAAPYFFPLDTVADWNRVYGKPGFLQHQSVIPKIKARDTLSAMLDMVSRRGSPSFLAVLKLMGADNAGLMAFPMEGYTLALDFPKTPQSLALLDDLDRLVAAAGGRLYLAKDARQSAEMVRAGYPNLSQFRAIREGSGAAARFSSLQSERLGL